MSYVQIIYLIIFYAFIAAVTLFLSICVVIYLTTSAYPKVLRHEEEKTFNSPENKATKPFPSIDDEFKVNLSVIVPAYNEEDRLPPMLDEAIGFLEKRQKEVSSYEYEIIIVSDGSKDQTVEVAMKYVSKYGSNKIRCLNLLENRGKGGAVRLGVQSCRGAAILFADADGATKFEDITKLENAMKDALKVDPMKEPESITNCLSIIIGSRAHLEKVSLAQRSIFRNILMYGFHFLVWLFTVKGIRDTQCGFKLFTRNAAHKCFESLHVNRWAFDVEILYIAQKLHIPIVEIPVRWTEIEGSKVTPVLSWIQMGCDLALIWLKYTLGVWKIKSKKTK